MQTSQTSKSVCVPSPALRFSPSDLLLLAAMVVLAVGVFAVLQTFTASRSLANRAEARDAMVAVARGEIQRIESLAWSNIALWGPSATDASTSSPR